MLVSELAEIITAAGSVLGPIAAIAAAVTSAVSAQRSVRNARAIQSIKVDINGRLTSLLELTAKASHAEGVLAEKARVETPVVPVIAPPEGCEFFHPKPVAPSPGTPERV